MKLIYLSLFLSLFINLPLQLIAQNSIQELEQLSYKELDSLMYIVYKKGQYDIAIKLMATGQKKAKLEFGVYDSVYADYTANLGLFYKKKGQYDVALELYEEAKDIREKVLGVYNPNYTNSLNNLALLYDDLGQTNKALILLTQAKDIRKKIFGKTHPKFATSLNNLANLHVKMGNFDKALQLLIQAKDINEKNFGENHPNFATALNNLANLYAEMGNFDKALQLLMQAKDIREKILGNNHPLFANSQNNLAGLHKRMGNYKRALPLYIQTKDIYKRALGEKHPKYANALNNLANLYAELNDLPNALSLSNQSKNIIKSVLGDAHPKYADALNNLAGLYKKTGELRRARNSLLEAKSIYEKVYSEKTPRYINILINLAEFYHALGDTQSSWLLLNQIMNNIAGVQMNHEFDLAWQDSLMQATYPSNKHIDYMLVSLTLVYKFLEKDSSVQQPVSKQIVVADLANDLLSKYRRQLSNDKDKLRILSKSNQWLLRSLNKLNKEQQGHKAFKLSDQNKSVLLLQATKSETAYRLGELPDSLIWEDRRLQKKQSLLRAKLYEKRTKADKDSLLNELNHVNLSIDAFVQMIEKEFPKYHKLKYQQSDAKIEDIQALLNPRTILLEYVIADTILHLFKIQKEDISWLTIPLYKNELHQRIKDFHNVLKNYDLIRKKANQSYQKYTQLAYWFYVNTISPALEDEQNIDNLIIVADGELGHLPFETFLTNQAPQTYTEYKKLNYLVNKYNISYNYSSSLWKENKESANPKNNGQILAFAANYSIKLDSSVATIRLPSEQSLRSNLIPLPSAIDEVETLQNKYQGFFALDSTASEKVIKQEAGKFAVLHLATHGILNAKRPILSSLAMTEDSDSIENNFWQAHEISKMQLNANLVVLSACETGYGKFETGNGIASLARAFMYAGSQALVVSLWQVHDYTTAEIMKNMYDNLAEGKEKDAALRQAKLEYIAAAEGILAHPAFWSPFVMMGKTSPIKIREKSAISTSWHNWAILLIVGIVGIFVVKRKKSVAA